MEESSPWLTPLQEENRRVMLRNVRVLSVIAMTLVPACSLLDYFAYPHLWWSFLSARVLVSSVEIFLLALTFLAFGQKYLRLLMLLVPMMPVICIVWMIHRCGDPASPYYAGLALCLVGVGYLYQWSYVECLIAILCTISLFFMATVPLLLDPVIRNGVDEGQFINNMIFLVANSIIIATGSHVHQRIRENEVISRFRLADNQKELEEKNNRLVEMDRLKTDFFSNVTHELRTPLTLMLAPLQRLQRLYAAENMDSHERPGLSTELNGIYKNALRLLRLINDLLDISSANSGRMQFASHPFSLPAFTSRLLLSLKSMAQHGGVEVGQAYRSHLDQVRGDEDKLEKVVLNLLFNAVKFTPSGGKVFLRVRELQEDLIIEVTDTGIGIPTKSLPFIFDRFWQADTSSTRQHPGTGLGLSVVKEFVERMGGRVEAESQVGKGTTMRVTLPIRREGVEVYLGGPTESAIEASAETLSENPLLTEAGKDEDQHTMPAAGENALAAWIKSIYKEAEQSQALAEVMPPPSVNQTYPAPGEEDLSKPLVLIADDEPGMLRFIRSELEDKFRVIEASEGMSALTLAEKFKPDLIISDYMMPNLDGLALCQALRARGPQGSMPIMLVTARSDEDVKMTALRNGANDVLVKPFSLTEFHTRVHNLVTAFQLRKEVESRNTQLEETLTELRSKENELMQSEKMAALGILTGGIMHEINNPLNFARSALYVLDRQAKQLPDGSSEEIGDIVSDLREGMDRIATIVSDLRTFCHPETALGATCALADPLQSAVRMLTPQVKESMVEIHEEIDPALCVSGDRNQLTLVFINIIKNSVDALASHPITPKDGRQIWVEARQLKQQIEVIIRDNGPGIAPQNLARIFDPFFTTKPSGEGTGMGLSLCYRIITAHGGTIAVQSEPGSGAKFVLRFAPATEYSLSSDPQISVMVT